MSLRSSRHSNRIGNLVWSSSGHGKHSNIRQDTDAQLSPLRCLCRMGWHGRPSGRTGPKKSRSTVLNTHLRLCQCCGVRRACQLTFSISLRSSIKQVSIAGTRRSLVYTQSVKGSLTIISPISLFEGDASQRAISRADSVPAMLPTANDTHPDIGYQVLTKLCR